MNHNLEKLTKLNQDSQNQRLRFFAKVAQEELFYSREVVLEKEVQLERCINYIKLIGFNFREEKYDEVDKLLSELGI